MSTLRTAVIGTGHLGAIHARVYAELEGSQLVGIVDTRAERAAEIASKHGAAVIEDYRELVGRVDAVSVATPTRSHHEIAKFFLENGVPVLVEKPITTTLEQAQDLVRTARERGVALQVGHIERFNPAVRALLDDVRGARFIEVHRLSPFKFRSTDIGVVLDLMIHDLDIILSLTESEVTEIRAAGVRVLSKDTEDIANARLSFANGCVANITASRISQTAMRKVRFFNPDSYVTCDMMKKEALVYQKGSAFDDFDVDALEPGAIDDPLTYVYENLIHIKKVEIKPEEPLTAALGAFFEAVRTKSEPVVTGEQGMRALQVAFDILAAIRTTLSDQIATAGLDPTSYLRD